jgi:hypothetical protein
MSPLSAPGVASETPSSEKVLELAKARLAACSYHAVRTVLCEFRHGLLILRGRLPSFFHKQVAQEAVAGLTGMERIVNQIEVVALAGC